MLASCDHKIISSGYSPLNYLPFSYYSAKHNFARGGTSLRDWCKNFDEWLPLKFEEGADVVWIQGESDLSGLEDLNTYALRLVDFFGRLSKAYKIERFFVVETTVTREVLRLNAPMLREQQASAVEALKAEGIDAHLISTVGIAMCGDGVHYSARGCYEVSLRLNRALVNQPEPAAFDVSSWSSRMQKAKEKLEAEMEEEMNFGSLLGGEKKWKMVNYTYGEIQPLTLFYAFSSLTPFESVADLGSGCGGVLLTAAMMGCETLIGVEAMQSYLRQSQLLLPAADLAAGDFCQDLRWITASVIVVCSTLYDKDLMNEIGSIIDEKAKDGTHVITLDKPLPSRTCVTVGMMEGEGSWGKCVVWLSTKGGGKDGVSTNTESFQKNMC